MSSVGFARTSPRAVLDAARSLYSALRGWTAQSSAMSHQAGVETLASGGRMPVTSPQGVARDRPAYHSEFGLDTKPENSAPSPIPGSGRADTLQRMGPQSEQFWDPPVGSRSPSPASVLEAMRLQVSQTSMPSSNASPLHRPAANMNSNRHGNRQLDAGASSATRRDASVQDRPSVLEVDGEGGNRMDDLDSGAVGMQDLIEGLFD